MRLFGTPRALSRSCMRCDFAGGTLGSVLPWNRMVGAVMLPVSVNRYHNAPVAKAFIKNIGIKKGALASSVAHDSHNIVAVGADDESLCKAINAVIKCGGGVSAVDNHSEKVLGLPVAGLMSTDNGYDVAAAYTAIDEFS